MKNHPSSTTRRDPAPEHADIPTPARTTDQALYDSLPPLVPVTTAAKILGLPRSSTYKYAADGHIEAQRLGSRIYILKLAIRKWLDGEVAPSPDQAATDGPDDDQAKAAAA